MPRIKRGSFGRDILNPLAEREDVESLKKTPMHPKIDLCLLENLFSVESREDQRTDSLQVLSESRRINERQGRKVPTSCAPEPTPTSPCSWLEWHPGSPSASPMALLLHLVQYVPKTHPAISTSCPVPKASQHQSRHRTYWSASSSLDTCGLSVSTVWAEGCWDDKLKQPVPVWETLDFGAWKWKPLVSRL